ncbi:MAG: hypothetical protein ACJAT2_000079 [Bacteriovoracaceae bacterium]|jgi:hypothetical protein
MKTLIKALSIVSLLFLVSCDPDDITGGENIDYLLGQPEIAGTGCDESRVRISDDGKSVEMETDSLTVKAGATFKSLDRINCLVAVPITVPTNYKVAVLPATFTGKHLLQKGATLKIGSETFLAGQSGQEASTEIVGKKKGIFSLGTEEFKDASVSKCGEDSTLRLNLRIYLRSKNKEAASIGKINGLAEGESSIFKLKFIKC